MASSPDDADPRDPLLMALAERAADRRRRRRLSFLSKGPPPIVNTLISVLLGFLLATYGQALARRSAANERTHEMALSARYDFQANVRQMARVLAQMSDMSPNKQATTFDSVADVLAKLELPLEAKVAAMSRDPESRAALDSLMALRLWISKANAERTSDVVQYSARRIGDAEIARRTTEHWACFLTVSLTGSLSIPDGCATRTLRDSSEVDGALKASSRD